MNPPNPFGSTSGGAFQAPNSSMKSGLFPTFRQQNSSQTQGSGGFFQPSAFGQPSAMNQQPAQGNLMFGQVPTFGQTAAQPPTFGQNSGQTSTFGQNPGQTSTFGQTPAQASTFGQTSAQPSIFGQTPAQTSTFGQTPAQTSTFGQTPAQTSTFGQTPAQTSTFGQTPAQTSTFGQTPAQTSMFGQTPAQTSTFGQTPAQTSTFGQTSGQTSIFGKTSAQTPTFGQTSAQTPTFGQASAQTPTFGQASSQTPTFGQNSAQTPTFGQTSAQPSIFGQTSAQSSTFGQTSVPSSTFGQTSTQPSIFGQTSAQPSIFGQTSAQPSIFGQTSAQPSTFGQTSAQPPTFGQTSAQPSTFGQTSAQPSTFGQTSAQPPTFGQTSAQPPTFGQTSAQPSTFGQTGKTSAQPSTFGQTGQTSAQPSTFGQTSAQPSTFGKTAQPPTFGQTSAQTSTFGQTSTQTPTFGQTSTQPLNFGQTSTKPSTFGQTPLGTSSTTSAFGLASAFGQASGFGKPSSGFRKAETTAGSTTAFGQTSSTSGATNVLNTVTPSKSFAPSEFTFKPIFSASPEPTNPQTTTLSTSTFSSSGPKTSFSSTSTSSTSGFSLPSGPKPAESFSFSHPAAAHSSSLAQSTPLTSSDSSAPANTIQFTFSQPAAALSSSKTTTTEPTTPSSFSFTSKTLQPKPTPLFGDRSFGQPLTFGDTEVKAEAGSDVTASSHASLGATNLIARQSKSSKRKSDPATTITDSEKPPPAKDNSSPERDAVRHAAKRALMRPRGPPPGLFGRALSGLRKDTTNPMKRDATKEMGLPVPTWEEADEGQSKDQSETPPMIPPLMREEKKAVDSDAKLSGFQLEMRPAKRGNTRTDSSDSLSGLSPTDSTIIQCKNIPPKLNKRDILKKHFSQFGSVQRISCRSSKRSALVHFDSHASAAKAKKKGKVLEGHELLLLFRRKSNDSGDTSSAEKERPEEKSQSTESSAASSTRKKQPLRPPLLSTPEALSMSSPMKKPSIVKTLQFDSEPQRESNVETMDHLVPDSLLHLIGQVVETAEDKFRLLEQKDKVLRQSRPKRTDLDLSKLFVGTCPDMCPEKERYMRETRKQLSVFEVILNTEMVDHKAAVKEYSRSSADQEEPLPHELRPLPVLSRTMDYLVTQIMDQERENYRDWYDFVWNRTRGIRKDITQQRLCCPLTVSLIEKCTRFHVHCAHHLCEEPMMTFDAKINNENMTKCLQSLKEMYEDLAMRQVFCPNEAEFRLYSVLLNLNEGDILREVQQFREEVRNSPEVKFAVNVFAAVNSNNFVRFFKLVKGAPYLASCLLHRYFNQVRTKALKALNMAHTVGPRSTAFPIEDMVRMLMFQNDSEAIDFIQQYGLNVNDGLVELSRVAYQEPELPPHQSKSEVILVKKMVLVGEVVNGGPLPMAPNHIPVCSFDAQDKYRGESSLAEPDSAQLIAAAETMESKDAAVMEQQYPLVPIKTLIAPPPPVPQEIREPAVTQQPIVTQQPPVIQQPTVTQQPPVIQQPTVTQQPPAPSAEPQQLFQPIFPPSPPPKPQPLYTDEEISAELDSVIVEVVNAGVQEVAIAGESYTKAALAESCTQVESLVGDVLEQMVQEMSSTEIKLEQERQAEQRRKEEEARRRKEHEDFLSDFSSSLTEQIVYEVIDESVQEAAAGEIQTAVNEKAERLAKSTEQVCCSLIEEILNADLNVLVEDVLEHEHQLIEKYIKRWRDVVTVRRQLKRQMRGFPAAPCCVDPRFKLKALAPSAPAQPSLDDLARGFVDLGYAGKLAVSSTRLLKMREETIHKMRVHYYYQQLLDDIVWAPLDLPAWVVENIPDQQDRIFWKAVLLLPSDHHSVASAADRILSDWLEVKFGGEQSFVVREEQAYGTLQTLCVINTLQEHKQRTHKVHIAVKASRGPLTQDSLCEMEELGALQGSRALIMLLPALPAVEPGEEEEEEQDIPLLSARLQLKQLQQVSSWYCPLPLVLFVPETHQGAADAHKYEEALMLNTLITEGVISEYIFYFIPETTNDLQGSKQLNDALCWLLNRAPASFPLSCHTLDHLIESALTQMFKPLVCSNSHERAEAFLPSQDPAPIIHLFNAVVAHIADKVTSEELCKLSWPPVEFCLPESRDLIPYMDWNSSEQLAWLKETILTLQLPQWNHCRVTDSWSEVCSGTFQYAAQIPSSRQSQPLLMSRLQNLVERVKAKAWYTHRPVKSCLRNDSEGSAYQEIPWVEVLMLFIDHKLKDWRLPRPPVCEDALTEDGEVLVYYLTDSLKGFTPPEEWIQTVNKTRREKKEQEMEEDEEEEASGAGVSNISAPLRQKLFHTAVDTDPDPETPVAQLDISYTPSTQEQLLHRLVHSIEEENAESKRSMEQLQRWLNGNSMDHVSLPLFRPSSTLLSTTTIPTKAQQTPTAKSLKPRPRHESEPEETSEDSSKQRKPSASPQFLLQQLQRDILACQEEERVCRLELSSLLSIVDD